MLTVFRCLLFTFLWLAACFVQAAEQIYTLEFFKTGNRTEAQEQALVVSGVAKVPCRVATMSGTFFLRCGKAKTKSELQAEYQRLKGLGLDKVELILTDDDKNMVLFAYQPIDVGAQTQAHLTAVARRKLSFSHDTHADAQKTPDMLLEAKKLQQADQGNKLVGRGWAAYEQKEFEMAIDVFKLASALESVKLPALFGLSLSYFNNAQYQESLAPFRVLLEEEYEKETVLPLYLHAALQLGKYDLVKDHIQQLPNKQQRDWLDKLDVLSMEKAYAAISKKAPLYKLIRFSENHQKFLERCEPSGVWESVGKKMVTLHGKTRAKSLYGKLWKSCKDPGIRIGILYQLNKISPVKKQLAMMEAELKGNIDKDYRRQLNDFKYNTLMEQASKLPPGSDEAGEIFSKIQRPYNVYNRYKLAKAWWHYQRNNYKTAMADFSWLWHQRNSKDALQGMLFSMMKLGDVDQALALAQKHEVDDILGLLIKEKLAAAEIPSDESSELAHQILANEPEYTPALSALGWNAVAKEQWPLARTYFLRWQSLQPEDEGAMIGLLQSYTKQQQFDDAFALAQKLDKPGENNWQYNVRYERALNLFNNKDYEQAEPLFADLKALRPKDKDLQTLHSWALFHQGKYKKSAKQFLTLYQQKPDKDIAQGYISSLDKLDKPKKKQAFIHELAGSDDPKSQRLAAGQYASQNNYLRAAFLDPSTNKYYTGVNNTEFWLDYNYYHKNGNHGISSLGAKDIQLGASFVWEPASRLYVTVNYQFLDADMRSDLPFLGNELTYGDIDPAFPGATLNQHSTKDGVWYPMVRYQREDLWNLDMGVGLSPLSTPLDSKLVWFFTADKGSTELSVYRRPMFNSQLNYTGIKDPYSAKKWGRVLETGVRHKYSTTFSDDYWLALTSQYNRYAGSNVIDNQGGDLSFIVGTDYSHEDMLISGGLTANMGGYQRNSIFYSFGHGGYFSPQTMWQAGIFTHFESKRDVVDWWEVDFSAGYFQWRTKPAERYPFGLFKQIDPGGKGSGISYRLRGEKHWRLDDNFEIGLSAQLTRSPGYEDWRAGIIFRYFWKSHNYLMNKHHVMRPWSK